MGVNQVIIIGNLGADPEMRFMPDSKAVTNFRVASSRRYTDNKGQVIEETDWVYVVVYGRLAENCNKYLNKGASVYVQGRLHTRSWVGEDERATKHYRQEIIGSNVQFLTKGQSDLESPDIGAIKPEDLPENFEHQSEPGMEVDSTKNQKVINQKTLVSNKKVIKK